jgi:tetratricopeptide (TPR) repeat protein
MAPAAGWILLWFAVGWLGCAGPAPVPVSREVEDAQRSARMAARLQGDRQWASAAIAWERAARQYRLLNRSAPWAVASHNEGVVLLQLGEWDKARDRLETAMRLNRDLGDTAAVWRNQLALLQLDIADPSADPVPLSLELEARQGELGADPRMQGLLAHELSRVRLGQGSLEEAAGWSARAEAAFTGLEDPQALGAVWTVRGEIAGAAGHWQEASGWWRRALELYQGQGDPEGVAAALAGWGRSLAADGSAPEEARRVLSLAVENLTDLGQTEEAERLRGVLDAMRVGSP